LSVHRKFATAIGVGAGALLALTACSSSPSSSTTVPASTSASSSASTSPSASASSSSGAQVVTGTGPKCSPGAPLGFSLKGTLVGFSQSEPLSNPFRATESASIEAAATAAGASLIQTNANFSGAKQLSDIEDLVSRGVKVLIVAPELASGLGPAFADAASHHIPVFTIDRQTAGIDGKVPAGSATCTDGYVSFAGSDFYKQGEEAAQYLIQATGGHANVAVLLGTLGNLVEVYRTSGFLAGLKGQSGMTVVAQQSGNFATPTGQTVMTSLLQAHPNINAVYSENDAMTYGAITAIQNAGKTAGKDVKLVTIDGTSEGVQDIVSGKVFADVETNPRFGPLVFGQIASYLAGNPVYSQLIISDHLFTQANAATALKSGIVY
jgi:ABC-type sugar transport system substrate-binding protein